MTVAFVERISEKSGTGRTGKPYTLYSMKLLSKDGEFLPGYYQCGFDKPPCKEGDYIKLEATKNDRGNFDVNVKSIKTSKNPPKKPDAPERKSSGGSKSSGGFQKDPATQKNIHYQNSRSAAIDAVALLLEHGGLKLIKADTKAGSASRFDTITQAIDKMTVKYFNDLESFRLFETVSDVGVADTSGDGELPDTEEESFDEDDRWGDMDDEIEDDFEDEDDDFE